VISDSHVRLVVAIRTDSIQVCSQKAFQIGTDRIIEINLCKLQSNMLHQISTNIKTKLHNSGKGVYFSFFLNKSK